MQKGQSPIFLLVGILVVVLVGTGAFYLGRSSDPKPPPTTPVITSQTPQPTQSPSSSDTHPTPTSTDETANWEIYTNSEYSYSFKYPTNLWISSETTETGPDNNGLFQMRVSDNVPKQNAIGSIAVSNRINNNKATLPSWVNTYMQSRGGEQIISSSNLTILSRPVILDEVTISGNNINYYLFLSRNDNRIVVLTIHSSVLSKDSLKNTVNKILPTFKFL